MAKRGSGPALFPIGSRVSRTRMNGERAAIRGGGVIEELNQPATLPYAKNQGGETLTNTPRLARGKGR